MKSYSFMFKAFLLLFLSGTIIGFGQIDEEVETAVNDSIDWETDDLLLSEVIIVAKGIIDLEEDRRTPVAATTILRDEIQDKGVGNVEFPEVMKSIPSVYVANQAGGFGDSEMFLRGFDQTNTAFLLNGQPINGMEDGKLYWSNWSAMTDVANAVQVQRGLGSSKLAISSVGGTVNIVTKATEKRRGGMARFVVGNDSYMKGTIAYDTGLQNKWGVSFMLDYWTAHRKYARGTAGEGQSYFFSVGYKPNDRHNLNFMIFGAPQWHDQNFSKGMETRYWGNGNVRTPGYDMVGIKGNPNYGFYKGEQLNARKNYYHKPVANLNWDWDINEKTALSTVLYASMGRGGGTGPLGNDADHINENMPGAYLPNGDINWDLIADYNNTIEGGIGSGFNGSAIRSSVNNHFWYGLVSNLNYDLSENLTFNVGADVRFYQGDHFRQLVNLLGLQGWRDWNEHNPDGFVVTKTFKANPWSSLFNHAKEGERIAYDYTEWVNYQGAFGQVEYANDWFSVFAQGAVSNQSYQREDRWNNPRTVDGMNFPLKSSSVNKTGYNVKGGFSVNLNTENTIFGNAGYYSRQPFLDDVFQGSDITGHADNTYLKTPEVDNEEITGFEVGYRYKTKTMTLNVNLYHTKWANRFLELSGGRDYVAHDGTEYSEVSFLLNNITQLHRGIEVDFNAKLHRRWTMRLAGSLGDWKYDGSSPFDVRDIETFTLIQGETGEANMDEIKIGNAPQFSFAAGTKFDVVKGLSVDVDFNYFARLWGHMEIRSINDIVQSEELAPYATVDAGLTYEFRFGDQKLRFRGNVYNLFDNTYIGRKDAFGYYYGLGRTFNAGIQYNF